MLLLLTVAHVNTSFKALFDASQLYDHTVHTTYIYNYFNFNELLWNYEFKNLLSMKIRLFTKILYYENLEPYGSSKWCPQQLICRLIRDMLLRAKNRQLSDHIILCTTNLFNTYFSTHSIGLSAKCLLGFLLTRCRMDLR